MKKLLTNLFFLFIVITIISLNFSSCKKDTECKVEIYTKLYSDTNIVVPFAIVKIEKKDVKVEGISDIFGRFTHTFPLEAILDVTCMDTTVMPALIGESTIRLVPGETVKTTVFIK